MRTRALTSVMRSVWGRAALSWWLTTEQQQNTTTWPESSSPTRSTTASWRSWRRPTSAPWLSWRACTDESCGSSPWSLWTWTWRRDTGGWSQDYIREVCIWRYLSFSAVTILEFLIWIEQLKISHIFSAEYCSTVLLWSSRNVLWAIKVHLTFISMGGMIIRIFIIAE